ncbi:MAG: PLP-dependent aminotransferase family protein [Tepidisphaeraceae bacterium]
MSAGCALNPEDVIVTCGCQEALILCLSAVAKRGDTIAVESPAYFGVLQALEALGMKALELPTDPCDGIDIAALRRVARAKKVRAVIVNPNHQNPMGFVMSDERKRALLDVIQKLKLPLIEDDCYGDLGYTTRRPSCIKGMDDSGLVLLCGSFSKTLAPGMRIGWCAPGKWREKVEKLKFCTSIAAPTLSQQVIARYLEQGGSFDRYLRRVTRLYQQHTCTAASKIIASFPPGTRVTMPKGGYVVWVEMPKSVDSMKLYERCLPDGICIAPGPMFSPSGRYRNFVRLSFASPWSAQVERWIETIGTHAKALTVTKG